MLSRKSSCQAKSPTAAEAGLNLESSAARLEAVPFQNAAHAECFSSLLWARRQKLAGMEVGE
jgi:hypothetical protein